MLGSDTDTTKLTIGITTSAEYQQLYSTNTAFVQSLYANILGREAAASEVDAWSQSLAGGASRGQVTLGFVTSTESLTQSIQQFYQVFFQRDADPAGLTNWVDQARTKPLSLVLGQMLSSPEFQFRAAAGMAPLSGSGVEPNQENPTPNQPTPPSSQPPIFTVGEPFINPYAVNRQSLVPDPVTDPAAWNDTPAPAPVPMHSPWGNAVVLPEVPYGTITTGKAVQPALTLPDNLISAQPE